MGGDVRDLKAPQAQVAELEAEIEATRRRLRALLAGSHNILWEVGPDGVVTMSEGQGLITMGLRPGQTVGMSVRDMYVELPEVLAAMERGLRGETFANTIEISGALFENHYFPQLAADGTLVSLLGVTLILGARPELKAERQRTEERLQVKQKEESLAVLAGGVAHDFNNLLVSSLGHAELALRLVHDDSAIAGHLREIIYSSQRSADLCRQLLAYAGRGQLSIDVFDLNRVVEDSIRLIELAVAKTSTLQTSLAPRLPATRGDVTQIAQVLINLMKNASDAAEGKQSTIYLETGTQYVEPDGRRFTIVAPDAAAGEYVFVRVRDEGVGMQPAVLGRIFDPFFSTKQTGRGLGLAAVVGIVRSHKGLLDVESEAGVGTTMVVYLPVVDQLREPPDAAPAAASRAQEGSTILLVDDEQGPRSVTRSMLEHAGYEVIEAENGREAVDRYRARGSTISLVLMDVSMPVMDGERALHELMAIDPGVKVILISGYTELDTATKLARRRPAAFLQKPYLYQQLLDVISSVVR
jgi:two-component system cell cycle sensor histidine kinase/response regulator CckA